MSTLDIVLAIYTFLGCVYWFWTLVAAIRVVRAVPLLAKQEPPEPAEWPKLSIVVPACNEADTLEAAMATIVGQDYPDLEIILVEDRSTDGTGEIVDRIAFSDERVRAVHVTELPEGWLGKVHALRCGVERADGDWVLFTDADVHFSPGTLRRAIAYAEHRELDQMAAAPDLWPLGFFRDCSVAMFLRTFCIALRVWAVENPRSRAFIGVGAFNLVRREAFDRTEGFEWLRLEVADDVGLGLMMKRSGAHCCLINGAGLIGLHWYPTLKSMMHGTEKAFASAGSCRVSQMLILCAMNVLLELAPLVAILPLGNTATWPAGVAMLAAGFVSVVILHRWARRPLLPGFAAPIGLLLNVPLLLRATWLGWWRGGILWRGTLYPSKILRKGSRVRLPFPVWDDAK